MGKRTKSKYKKNNKLTIYGKLDVNVIKHLMELTGAKSKNKVVEVLAYMVMYQNKEIIPVPENKDNLAYAARNGKAIKTKDGKHLTIKEWEYCKEHKILPWITYYDTINGLITKQ